MINQKEIDIEIKKYLELKKKTDEIKKEMDSLKEHIVGYLKYKNVKSLSTEDDSVIASISTRETYAYTDEKGIIDYLEQNGYNEYVKKSIVATTFNKELKKNTKLCESLNKMYSKTVSDSLTVKSK